jgi:transaldolase
MSNPLLRLQEFGQSPWFDCNLHTLLASGDLKRMIEQDGLRGTSFNPGSFEKTMAGGLNYVGILPQIREKKCDPKEVYEALAIGNVRLAADIIRPIYETTKKRDGYASLDVSPYLARDTKGTIEEARRLWQAVNKANVMIKVPATREGIPAIRQLISEGINVNVTLLFSVESYGEVADAYMHGLIDYFEKGGDLSRVASVASFFVSPIDTAADALIEKKLKESSGNRALLKTLVGKSATASAKLAYIAFKKIVASPAWKALEKRGAQKQRLLWACTGTNNPAYRNTMYVEELIGPETVNAIPPATFTAFRDRGQVRSSLLEHLEDAHGTLDDLDRADIDLKAVTDGLLQGGLLQSVDGFDKLLAAVDLARKVPMALLESKSRMGPRSQASRLRSVPLERLRASKCLASKPVALVQGVESGIGLSIAKLLSLSGFVVYASTRMTMRSHKPMQALSHAGISLRPLAIGLLEMDQMAAATQQIEEEHGRLDILINHPVTQAIATNDHALELRTFTEIYASTIIEPAYLISSFRRLMDKSSNPGFLMLSSDMGGLRVDGDARSNSSLLTRIARHSSKTALQALVAHYARDLNPLGYRVNAADPSAAGVSGNSIQAWEATATWVVSLANQPKNGQTGYYFSASGNVYH